jgi:hypothetical protein
MWRNVNDGGKSTCVYQWVDIAEFDELCGSEIRRPVCALGARLLKDMVRSGAAAEADTV